jgi:N utilization substance protein A
LQSTSRDNDEVRRLFREQVPEIASGSVEIVGVAREGGCRAMVVVHASDAGVDPVGACVGRRGERIKAVSRALRGDRIHIILWSEPEQSFIGALLAPAKIKQITFDATVRRATVTLSEDTTTKLTEDGGIHLQLASRLAGWDLRLGGT